MEARAMKRAQKVALILLGLVALASLFAGVLAPNSTWRASVVPNASDASDATHGNGATQPATSRPKTTKAAKRREATNANPSERIAEEAAETTERRTSLGAEPQPSAHLSSRLGERATESTASPASARSNRTGIAPEVYARIDWANLLKRTFIEDVLACPCGGRRRIVCDVNERETIVEILTHLGLPEGAPKLARARDPPFGAA